MADPPKRAASRRELNVWTAATLCRFLEATTDDELFPLWFFLATTGTRRGEALGLPWNDIDLDAKKSQDRSDRDGHRLGDPLWPTQDRRRSPPHRP
jgi:integrase